jgi:hypothetical protein
MTARDAGGIASRMISVFLAVQALENGSMTAFFLQPAMRYASRRPVPTWPSYAISAGVFAVGAILFWVLSNRFWSPESEPAQVDLEKLKRIGFQLMGAFFLIDYGGSGLAEMMSRASVDLTARAFPNARWEVYFGIAFIGLVLLVANTPRSAVPDFDQMR